jgi:peptide/nickel transport system substrate-binding protein
MSLERKLPQFIVKGRYADLPGNPPSNREIERTLRGSPPMQSSRKPQWRKESVLDTCKPKKEIEERRFPMNSKGQFSKSICFSIILCVLVFITIFGSAYAASPAQPSKPRYGGILRIADAFEGASIGYPPKLLRIQGFREALPALETLIRMDKSGKPIPWLAAEYKESAKDKTITLTLRKGVKFHDGTDFNAEAVKWNLDQCIAVKTAGTEKFSSVDIINNSTVRINLTEWDSTVISNLAQTIGLMISPSAYKKNGEAWCEKNPIGTGPYQIVNWEKDVLVAYKRFDGYWQKGKPYLDRIEYRPIVDEMTRQMSFKTGEFHLAIQLPGHILAPLEKEGSVVTLVRRGSGAMSMVPNSANQNSPFAKLKVRQAVQHAIDTKGIVNAIFRGNAEAANQHIYKGHWGYNPEINGYPYNPAKAKQLLAEAGYPNGFKTKILFQISVENDQIFTAVQGYLREVGIDAELDRMEQTRYNQITRGGQWEGLLRGSLSPSPDVVTLLAMFYAGGGFFKSMLIPEDYNNALQNAVIAPDFKSKQKWAREAMRLMVDKYCLGIMLFCSPDSVVAQPYVHNHGFMQTPHTGLWTPEDAWLEK